MPNNDKIQTYSGPALPKMAEKAITLAKAQWRAWVSVAPLVDADPMVEACAPKFVR